MVAALGDRPAVTTSPLSATARRTGTQIHNEPTRPMAGELAFLRSFPQDSRLYSFFGANIVACRLANRSPVFGFGRSTSPLPRTKLLNDVLNSTLLTNSMPPPTRQFPLYTCSCPRRSYTYSAAANRRLAHSELAHVPACSASSPLRLSSVAVRGCSAVSARSR